MTAHYIRPDWPAPPGVFARCSTRLGGSSKLPWHSFNLGHHVGDDPLAVAANRHSLTLELPANTGIQWLQQVHGSGVIEATADGACPSADSCWTADAGLACAVLTADCLPVLFCTRSGDAVAAAHAGWRGLRAGVLEATVDAMGAEPSRVIAWLGPAIGPAAFEVGGEVRQAFLDATTAATERATSACFVSRHNRSGSYLADLYTLARIRLAGLGLAGVYGGNFCTFSDPRRFYSYRRDGETGRMASLILRLPDGQ